MSLKHLNSLKGHDMKLDRRELLKSTFAIGVVSAVGLGRNKHVSGKTFEMTEESFWLEANTTYTDCKFIWRGDMSKTPSFDCDPDAKNILVTRNIFEYQPQNISRLNYQYTGFDKPISLWAPEFAAGDPLFATYKGFG